MMKYEYVSIDCNKFIGAVITEHRAIINKQAEKGYRYVGYIPTKISDYGKIKKLDLIFEKKSDI